MYYTYCTVTCIAHVFLEEIKKERERKKDLPEEGAT